LRRDETGGLRAKEKKKKVENEKKASDKDIGEAFLVDLRKGNDGGKEKMRSQKRKGQSGKGGGIGGGGRRNQGMFKSPDIPGRGSQSKSSQKKEIRLPSNEEEKRGEPEWKKKIPP